MKAPDIDVDDVGEEDWVEDQLMIDQVEPGKIWFEGGIGPIQVPKRASELAQPGWMVFIVAARRNAGGICSRSAPSTHSRAGARDLHRPSQEHPTVGQAPGLRRPGRPARAA